MLFQRIPTTLPLLILHVVSVSLPQGVLLEELEHQKDLEAVLHHTFLKLHTGYAQWTKTHDAGKCERNLFAKISQFKAPLFTMILTNSEKAHL